MNITTEALTKVHPGGRRALDDVDLHIEGGTVGLLGANGAGKTTLLRILTGVLRPTSGRVVVAGHDLATTAGLNAMKRTLGYLPQELSPYPDLTAREFLDYIAVLKGIHDKRERRREVGERLAEVGLEDRAGERLGGFSGGMRRQSVPELLEAVGRDLIRRYFSAPARDITLFLDALLFNFAIANHDAHGKNYSLLLEGPGAIRLAPLYDLLSTVIYDGADRKLAMRYGGENRPAYLRGRHLDRLARDLAVKPALVRRRALSMCERLEAAQEAARRSLPEEFQQQPVVERMVGTIAERVELLRKRATEAGPAAAGVPERLDEFIAEMQATTDRIRRGFEEFNSAAEAIGRVVGDSNGPPAPEDLEGPSRRLRIYGRDVYDAVVEFEVFVESVLEDIRLGEETSAESGQLIELARLSEMAGSELEVIEAMYRQVSAIEEISPVYRTPVRNMRSGFRDLLEARTIISGWKQRSEAARGQAG